MTDPLAALMSEVDAELGQQEAPPTEEAPAEQARDEQGRFAPQESEQAEPEPDAGAVAEEMILGKFKSPDDLAKSYEALESKLDQQGAELGELRKLREEFDAQQQQAQYQQQQVPINQETVDWFDEQVEQNPQGAVMWAMQSDPFGFLYNRAMDSWHDIQPRQASAFERQMEMGALAQAVSQQIATTTAPYEERALENDFVSAWNSASQSLPDLSEHSDAILEAAQSAPEVITLLKSGTLQDKQRVIENLYYLAKGKQATSLSAAAQDMAAQQAQETQAAKDQSFVASSGQRSEPDTRSNVDRWFEEVLDPALAQYT